jgi:hypothetical protein
MNRGNAFVDAIGPVKAAFIEHAMPADFDEQLAGLLAEFAAAGVRTNGGCTSRWMAPRAWKSRRAKA